MKANLQIPSLALASLVAIALVRCGASDDDGAAGSGGSGAAAPADASVGSGGTGGGSTSDGSVPEAAPPEQELESSYRTPVSTGRYVWTANPDSGRVALIDAFTMEIRIEEAGFGPTYLAAISDPQATDDNSAIVLNVHSHDATLFQVAKDGALTKRSFETHEGANAWVVSPNGNWAIAWTEAPSSADPTQGNQDVTVIDLAGGGSDATRLSVGYRPTRVAFDAAESRIFAVTEPGITVISLENSSPTVDRLIEVTDDPLENPASRDVTITPDGSLALVRRDGSADVGLVDLTTGARTAIPLSAPVTDLDLTEDGTLAVAVVRDSAEIVLLPIPEVAQDPNAKQTLKISGEFFGSVALSADASRALLYTNAVASDRLTIVDLAALEHRTVSVKTPIFAVFPAPSAAHAITLQKPGSGSNKAGAFSVVPTEALISPKITGTDAPPSAVAIGNVGDRALVTVRDDLKKLYGVYLARLSNLQVDFVKLASPPLATGIVPSANKGYVAQEHPEGRITFVDLLDGSVRTLTGFELGAKVVD